MLRIAIKTTLCLALVLSLTAICFASDMRVVDVKAYIPQQNGLSVSISRVDAATETWTPASAIDFETLVFDNVNKIFTAKCYYALDVGVTSTNPDWTVTHTATSVINGSESLDNNVNVVFVKQLTNTTYSILTKLSYANSNNQAFTKTQLSGGWLRIYYGIATGEAGKDSPGTTPIPGTKTYGNYQGQVTFTLTP